MRVWTSGILAGLVAAMSARGADIQVVKVGAGKSTLDLSGLAVSGSAGSVFLAALNNDLVRSGWFTILPGTGTIKVTGTGSESRGRLSVRCAVRAGGREYLNKTCDEAAERSRRLAHRLADDIVFAVKGVKGIASTRIAMVGNIGGRKDIYVCDADGGSLMQITRDGAPCISPRWSPDGRSIIYTSFKTGFPDVYLIDLQTYERRRVSNFPGLNAGADIAPDGRSIAIILSKDGNPDLYTMGLGGGGVARLTRTARVAEASPSWAPDGRRLVYVANATGLPQLYIMTLSGSPKRVSFTGSENIAPDWGPSGIAYSSRREGRYTVCWFNPETGRDVQLTAEYADYEDPSWAPDGRHVVAGRTAGYHSDVYLLDVEGDAPVRLTAQKGEWYSPAWSPR